MADTPTYAVRPSFLGIERRDRQADYVVAGIPMDIGTTNRAGTRDGPGAIRRASRMLTDGDHPEHWVEPARMSLSDIGDFSLGARRHPGQPGGDRVAGRTDRPPDRAWRRARHHPAAAAGPDAAPGQHRSALVHFDAHVDTWPDNFGQAFAHGSPFYHAINEGLVDPHRMIQIGIRSPVQRAVMDWTAGAGRHDPVRPGCPCATPGRGGGADRRGGRRRPGLSQLRHRCARPRLRPRHRHAGGRRAGDPGRRRPSCGGCGTFASSAWMWSRSRRPTTWPRSPRWPPRPWSGSIWRCLAATSYALRALAVPQKRIACQGDVAPISALLASDRWKR